MEFFDTSASQTPLLKSHDFTSVTALWLNMTVLTNWASQLHCIIYLRQDLSLALDIWNS